LVNLPDARWRWLVVMIVFRRATIKIVLRAHSGDIRAV
jgi:hypothetical protein